MKIYIASSWRNPIQDIVVAGLRENGFEVYDFKHPTEGNEGFHWRDVGLNKEELTVENYLKALKHPTAEKGYQLDFQALLECDACVLVLPCGRSAHLELGWACGMRKHTGVLLAFPFEPELMYKMVDFVDIDYGKMLAWLKELRPGINGLACL